jgi:hypothetical protein
MESLTRALANPRVRDGADVVVMTNWEHFEGAGGDQIILIWIVPDSMEGRASIVIPTTREVAGALKEWSSQTQWIGKIRFPSTKREVIIPPSGDAWKITDAETVLAPSNADAATAHLLDFGW